MNVFKNEFQAVKKKRVQLRKAYKINSTALVSTAEYLSNIF